jgi:hypothetical protein
MCPIASGRLYLKNQRKAAHGAIIAKHDGVELRITI